MADWQVAEDMYITDGTNVFEVVRLTKRGAAMPRQRYMVRFENIKDGRERNLPDVDVHKKFEPVCKRMTDDELFKRYKAIGREYEPEPKPEVRLYDEAMEKLMCR